MLQQLINGLFLGSVYALFALGYTLIFGVLDILNLAHQAIFMMGAFIALYLVLSAGLDIFTSLILAMLIAGVLGIVLDLVAFRPLRGRQDTHLSGMISSIAVAIIFEAIVLYFYGARTVRFPATAFPDAQFSLGDATISLVQIIIFAISVALMAGLHYLIRYTKLGKAMRAVAENPRAAKLLGIDVDWVIAQSFFISSGLGGAAGVLYGLAFNAISPDMGRYIELKGLAVIIVGGMGSIPGAMIGGFVLGLTEVLSIGLSGRSNLRDAIAFTLLFLILLVRPSGILGAKRTREA